MIEILLIIVYLSLCIIKDEKWIVCSLIILFPGHIFIKQLIELFIGPTSIFPLWYDIAISILFFKTIIKHHSPIRYKFSFLLLVLMLFFQFSSSYFTLNPEPNAIATFRLYLHCIALFITFSIIKFKTNDLSDIGKIFIYATIFYCIAGIIIYFFFQQEFHILLGHIEFGPKGMRYSSPSFLIMGYERMFGMVGGPNQFGVYLAFTFVYLFFIKSQINPQISPLLINVAFLLCIICIILSFSRAGWAIVAITITFLYLINGNAYRAISSFFKISLLLCVLLIVINCIVPEAFDIIISSLNGDESSAAARGDIVKYGFSEITRNLGGHGLGTGTEKSGTPISESSIIICLYELGVFITAYYYVLIIIITYRIFKAKIIYSKILSSFVIATLITSIVSMNPFQYPYIYYFWSILGIASNYNIIQYLKQKKYEEAYPS